MKPYFNISNFLDGYNALLAGWTLLLAGTRRADCTRKAAEWACRAS